MNTKSYDYAMKGEKALIAFSDIIDDNLSDEGTLENKTWQTLMVDLLADLRHFAKFKGINFSQVIRYSEVHYKAEQSGRD